MIQKTGKRLKKLVLPKFSLPTPKNLSCPKFGGSAAPLAPPARTPMVFMSDTYVSHTKPWSRMQSLSESRGGSKVTKPIFSNSIKRYWEVQRFFFPGGSTAHSLIYLPFLSLSVYTTYLNRQQLLTETNSGSRYSVILFTNFSEEFFKWLQVMNLEVKR